MPVCESPVHSAFPMEEEIGLLHYRICTNEGVKHEPLINTRASSLKEISVFANPETSENEAFVFSCTVIKSYLFGYNSSSC